MTVRILIALALGGLAGYFIIPDEMLRYVDNASMFALYVLIFLVGIEIGVNKDAFKNLKALGKKVIMVSASVFIGTFIGGLIAGAIFGMAKNISLSIAAGFGWYSLTAILMKELGGAELGTIAFMTNVVRELIALLLIPILAKKVNFCTAIAPAGATAMDTTLPMIARSTDNETSIVAFSNGLILSTIVPILVPLLYGLPW